MSERARRCNSSLSLVQRLPSKALNSTLLRRFFHSLTHCHSPPLSPTHSLSHSLTVHHFLPSFSEWGGGTSLSHVRNIYIPSYGYICSPTISFVETAGFSSFTGNSHNSLQTFDCHCGSRACMHNHSHSPVRYHNTSIFHSLAHVNALKSQ
mgnify:CR=1 FL=1